MWLKHIRRKLRERESLDIRSFPKLNRHRVANCSSVTAIRAARHFAELSSNRFRHSARDLNVRSAWGRLDAAKSIPSSIRRYAPNNGMVAQCMASLPIAIDFGCGRYSGLSSGTLSRVRRVFDISESKSSSRTCAAVMVTSVGMVSSQLNDNHAEYYLRDSEPRSSSCEAARGTHLGLGCLFFTVFRRRVSLKRAQQPRRSGSNLIDSG